MRMAWIRGVVLGLTVLLAGSSVLRAQEPAAAESAAVQAEGEFRGRLPAFFASVVTDAQRQQIYEIQKRFHEEISKLEEQLEQLRMQRDAEVENVLTAEQRAEISQMREEARKRRAAQRQSTPVEPGSTTPASQP